MFFKIAGFEFRYQTRQPIFCSHRRRLFRWQ